MYGLLVCMMLVSSEAIGHQFQFDKGSPPLGMDWRSSCHSLLCFPTRPISSRHCTGPACSSSQLPTGAVAPHTRLRRVLVSYSEARRDVALGLDPA